MIKKQMHIDNESYIVTPSLLNAWAYIWLSAANVREAESDTMSLEDKQADAQKKAYDEFLNTLNRIKLPPNEYMKRGIEFEDKCYKGETIISPIIEGGSYQIVGTKTINVCGLNILLYGKLDVLKGGVIYDIKRVIRYSPQKYQKSYQHGFYFELFPDAKKFTYLVYDDMDKLHQETYYRDECTDIQTIVRMFLKWLQDNDLMEIYKIKWNSKEKSHELNKTQLIGGKE